MLIILDKLTAFVSLTVLCIGLWFYWRNRKQGQSRIFHSSASMWSGVVLTWRVRYSWLSHALIVLALCSWVIALGDPVWLDPSADVAPPEDIEDREFNAEKEPIPTEGIAIYLVLDQSGSMRQEVLVGEATGQPTRITRMEYLKLMTSMFVFGDERVGLQGRKNDLIGLITFARMAHVISPLTLDHWSLKEYLESIDTVRRPSEDGTAIGYAIFKTAKLIQAIKEFSKDSLTGKKSAYDMKSQILILVTDGLHQPHPDDMQHPLRSIGLKEAASSLITADTRLYIINIEPAILQSRYSVFRQDLKEAAESTGGRLFVLDPSTSLLDVYAEIDQLEKSNVQGLTTVAKSSTDEDQVINNQDYERYLGKPLFQYFIALGLLFFTVSLSLESTCFRRIP